MSFDQTLSHLWTNAAKLFDVSAILSLLIGLNGLKSMVRPSLTLSWCQLAPTPSSNWALSWIQKSQSMREQFSTSFHPALLVQRRIWLFTRWISSPPQRFLTMKPMTSCQTLETTVLIRSSASFITSQIGTWFLRQNSHVMRLKLSSLVSEHSLAFVTISTRESHRVCPNYLTRRNLNLVSLIKLKTMTCQYGLSLLELVPWLSSSSSWLSSALSASKNEMRSQLSSQCMAKSR